MKEILLMTLSLTLLPLYAGTKATPLDLKIGQWKHLTDPGSIQRLMEKTMSNIPKESRAMMKKMLTKSLKKTMGKPQYQCITAEDLKSPEASFKKSFHKSSSPMFNNCEMKLSKSTNREFHGKLVCKDKKQNMNVSVISKDSSHMNVKVKMKLPNGQDHIVVTNGTWMSKDCTQK